MRPLLLSNQKFYLGGKYSMNVSERGKDLIKSYEGCRLEAYYCPSGVLTIGYGHTGDVYPGQVITQAEADALFDQDIVGYVNSVRAYEDQLNQNQFDALVSFCYNCGVGAYKIGVSCSNVTIRNNRRLNNTRLPLVRGDITIEDNNFDLSRVFTIEGFADELYNTDRINIIYRNNKCGLESAPSDDRVHWTVENNDLNYFDINSLLSSRREYVDVL